MCFFFLSASAWQDSPVVSWPAHAPTRIFMYVYICISVYPFNLRNIITKLAFTDADSPLCLLTSSGLPPKLCRASFYYCNYYQSIVPIPISYTKETPITQNPFNFTRTCAVYVINSGRFDGADPFTFIRFIYFCNNNNIYIVGLKCLLIKQITNIWNSKQLKPPC